jgi:hypothetical protein
MNKFQQAGKTKVVKGSILYPENSGLRFILSITNLAGKLDNPLLQLFDKKWSSVRREMKGWYASRDHNYKLGALNTIATQSDVWVIQMLCQDENLRTNVEGLEKCIKEVSNKAKYEKASVHVSTLLTEAIPELPALISKYLIDNGVSVYFYEEVK